MVMGDKNSKARQESSWCLSAVGIDRQLLAARCCSHMHAQSEK
jgi:hypothetical protein